MTLNIVNDSIVELDEDVDLNIDAVSGPAATIGSHADHEVMITNDDTATLFFTNDPVLVTESDVGTTASFHVRLSNDVDAAVDVSYSTNDGTATLATNDYLLNSGTLNFVGNANETISIVVSLVGDVTVEANETYLVDLLTIAAGGRDVTFAENQAVGHIINDDTATVTVTGVADAEENGPFDLQLALSAPVDAAVTVDLSTVDIGDASGGGVDYTDLVDQRVSFPAGSTAAISVPVTINNDNIVEATENFEATLSNLVSTLATSITLGGNATSTIENADTSALSIDDVTVDEGDGTATFTVSLSNPIDIDLDVNVSYADISATGGGTDYDDGVDTVQFLANSTTSQTVTVGITDDNLFEATETFSASLSIVTPLARGT